jgi:hypothetical protein
VGRLEDVDGVPALVQEQGDIVVGAGGAAEDKRYPCRFEGGAVSTRRLVLATFQIEQPLPAHAVDAIAQDRIDPPHYGGGRRFQLVQGLVRS